MSLRSDYEHEFISVEELRSLAPKPVNGLDSLDLDGIASFIREGKAKNIIIMQGAGISCAAGIPDFRSPGIGLYYNLQKFNLPYSEAIFDINYFKDNPEPFFQLSKDMLPEKFEPTPAHYLPVLFHKHGLFLKLFTQNIDGLERATGMPPEMIVESHGTFLTAKCTKCQKEYTFKDIKAKMEKGEIPYCAESACKGVIKPDIVFFNEDLPHNFFKTVDEDFPKCDLLIVIGTSLKVAPFNSILKKVKENVPRILINRECVATYKEKLGLRIDKENGKKIPVELTKSNNLFKFDHYLNRRDIFISGDIQDSVLKLVEKIGWKEEYDNLIQNVLK